MNDCEGHETIFVEATEICLIFDYYDINKVGNSYRLRLFDFTPLILVCLFFSPQLLNLTIRFSGFDFTSKDTVFMIFNLNYKGRSFQDWLDYV